MHLWTILNVDIMYPYLTSLHQSNKSYVAYIIIPVICTKPFQMDYKHQDKD